MYKITNYMVTQTSLRRTVSITREYYVERNAIGGWNTEAVTYSYGPRDLTNLRDDEDAWSYTVPNGETFTHPNKHGCLHMIINHAIGIETGHTKAHKVVPFTQTHQSR
jgi:hypothetical protein